LFSSILFLGFLSCEKLEKSSTDIVVKEITYGKCKQDGKSDIFPEYPESIAYKTIDKNWLAVKHVNAVFNCCLPKGIGVKVTFSGDSVIVSEFEVEQGLCDCICPYDVSYRIGPLVYGDYLFVLRYPDGRIRVSFPFRFDDTTEGIYRFGR